MSQGDQHFHLSSEGSWKQRELGLPNICPVCASSPEKQRFPAFKYSNDLKCTKATPASLQIVQSPSPMESWLVLSWNHGWFKSVPFAHSGVSTPAPTLQATGCSSSSKVGHSTITCPESVAASTALEKPGDASVLPYRTQKQKHFNPGRQPLNHFA